MYLKTTMAFTTTGPVSRKYLDQCIATHNKFAEEREKKLKKCTIEKQELLQEIKHLKKELRDSEVVEVELFQENDRLKEENQKLKKELESLKQFELDRILDASMNEIFTTERQFLRESMIL